MPKISIKYGYNKIGDTCICTPIFHKDIIFDIIGEFPPPPSPKEIFHFYCKNNFSFENLNIPFSHPLQMVIGDIKYKIIEFLSLDLTLCPFLKNLGLDIGKNDISYYSNQKYNNLSSFLDAFSHIPWHVIVVEKDRLGNIDRYTPLVNQLDDYNEIRSVLCSSFFFPKDYQILLQRFLFSYLIENLHSTLIEGKKIFTYPREEKLCHILFPEKSNEEILNSIHDIYLSKFDKNEEFPSFILPSEFFTPKYYNFFGRLSYYSALSFKIKEKKAKEKKK